MTMITIVRKAACIIIIINDKKGDFRVRFCSLLEILHASLIGGFKNKVAFLSEAPLKLLKLEMLLQPPERNLLSGVNKTSLRSKSALPLHRVEVRGALGAADGVDAAVHHAHPDPVPRGVEGGSLAPLVGHGVVAAQRVGLGVGLERQVPASHLQNEGTEAQKWSLTALLLKQDGSTYGVEQPEQSTGSQAAARVLHVRQFQPEVLSGVVGLHQCQRMLPVSRQNQVKGERQSNPKKT